MQNTTHGEGNLHIIVTLFLSLVSRGGIFGVKLWDINELWIGRGVEGGGNGLVLGTTAEKSHEIINVPTDILYRHPFGYR